MTTSRKEREQRIGYVTYEIEGQKIVAELYSRETWRVLVEGQAHPAMGQSLSLIYEDSDLWGPAAGSFGAAVLADLAARTGGESVYELPIPKHDPGIVY